MTLLLAHAEIDGLLAPEEAIAAVRAGLLEQARGEVQVPPRTTINSSSGRGWLRVMPAILNGSGVMGYKAMHSTPGVGVRYLVMLYDLASGALLAALDADWLTSERTAAVAAVAAEAMARERLHGIGLLGSSGQARRMLAAVAVVRKLPPVKVFSPNPEHRRRFAEAATRELGIKVTPVASAEAAVVDSDLVLSMFRAGASPVLKAEWLGAGTHVSAASSIRPEARELEDAVWTKSARVAVDDRAHAFESGDGRSALAQAAIRPERVIELWEVVGGRSPGRQNAAEITLFKSVGTALQDLALAAAIYRRARERGLGTDLGDFPHVR